MEGVGITRLPPKKSQNLFPAGGVAGGGGGVGLTRVSSSGGGRVDGLSGVGHLGHEAVGVVGGVGGRLDTAVGKGDCEGASNVAGSVLGLGLPEVGLAVVVGDAVLVGVRLRNLLHDGNGGGGVLGGGGGHKGEGGYQLKKMNYEKFRKKLPMKIIFLILSVRPNNAPSSFKMANIDFFAEGQQN